MGERARASGKTSLSRLPVEEAGEVRGDLRELAGYVLGGVGVVAWARVAGHGALHLRADEHLDHAPRDALPGGLSHRQARLP